ncbi:protein FAM161A [Uranotaenia lowii]|uniref:protein FAM161A n=1 Tax=Uranotaenia lowii TaxID=190385 RepID=UPI0024786CA2|nr:protein FAM161A [Uranotaenia lowii]
MSGHGRSVFINSCVKKPLNPRNKLPNPSYLVPQCSLDRGLDDPQLQSNMNTITRKKATNKCPLARAGCHPRRNKGLSITNQLRKETDNFQSLVKFYDSIPDYDELHHLPNDEFYYKLNTLRKKQRELRTNCFNRTEKLQIISPSLKTQSDDNDSLTSWSKSPPSVSVAENTLLKPPATKSVRIETTAKDEDEHEERQSRRKFRAGTPFVSDPEDSIRKASTCTTPANSEFVERYDRYVKRNLRCKSASPIRDYSKITIPHPYKMTQREEDERALQELLIASKNAFSSKETINKLPPAQIKANPVPITSRIPLFDTIMADQEYRSRLVKLNSEIELQSQIKPFHFSERLSRPSNNRCLSRSLSSPALLTTGLETPTTNFKAKPCPKNLFSNYFYFKMWEDEYFRDMNKRLRAEEMLKQASLPPAMARRERLIQRSKLSSADEELGLDPVVGTQLTKKTKRKRKSKRSAKRKKSAEQKCVEYFASMQQQQQHQQSRSMKEKLHYPSSNSSCASTSADRNPTPIYPVNRPNLAATLRTEWCRKKLRDLELEDNVASIKRVPKFQWGVKKSQAFQNLNLDHTHQEELNLRLATRRAEQKLRHEEHAINMELMRQRVKAAPLLLEGPPQWGPRLGHVTHRCLTTTKDLESPFPKPERTSIAKGERSSRKEHPTGSGGKKREASNNCPGRSNHHHQHRQFRSNGSVKNRSCSKLSDYSMDSFDKISSKFCGGESDFLGKLDDDELGSFGDEV